MRMRKKGPSASWWGKPFRLFSQGHAVAKARLPLVILEPQDDRLATEKLTDAYAFFIPTTNWPVGKTPPAIKQKDDESSKEVVNENSSNLCKGIL